MTILSKAAILAAVDLKTEDVPVPEWGGTVRVASMSGKSRDEFFGRQPNGSVQYSQFAAAILVATIVDENGQVVFDEEDVDALRAKSPVAIERVVAVAMRLNGIGPNATEEAEKNSGAAQSGDSGSASQLSSGAQ